MATATSDRSVATGRTAINLVDIPEATLIQRYGTTRAEVEAVKKALAPDGTTDFEMLLYLGVCKRLGLDPFVPGLVHFMRFKKKDGSERTGIVLGVYGYLEMAQQQKDCDGLAVKCYPEDVNAAPTHATCTVWKKNWSHPLEVQVTYKEKKPKNFSPFWESSPRQALETAAIRRACRLAWPALFAPMEDDEPDEAIPIEARGRVGTVLGEHHELPTTPVIVDAEARLVDAPALPTSTSPVTPPAPAPEDPKQVVTGEDPKWVVTGIRDVMEDPAVRDDTEANHKAHDLLNTRLDAMGLKTVWDAKTENIPALRALLEDLRRVASGK